MSWTTREIAEARRLREAGASYTAIANHFNVTHHRVMYALDSAFAERERERARMGHERSGYKVSGAMARRMVALREAGLPYPQIAAVMLVYHGRKLSAATVEKYVRHHAPHLPSKPRGIPFGSVQAPRRVAA